jgi:integrase
VSGLSHPVVTWWSLAAQD